MTDADRQGQAPLAEALPCYLCGTPTSRVCTDCGRFFCPQHGGKRMCIPPGSGFAFPIRILCDGCAPNQEEVRAAKEAVEALMGCVVGMALTLTAVAGYFFWKAFSVPLPKVP